MIGRTASWFIDRTIASKIVACSGILVVLALGGGLVTLHSLKNIDESDRRTIRAYRVLDTTKQVWIGILKQESDVRGYLLTNDDGFYTRARDSEKAVQSSLADINRLTISDPDQQMRIGRLGKAIEVWRHQAFDGIGPGSKPSAAGAALGAEGALNRILKWLEEINTAERSTLAIRDGDRAGAFALTYLVSVLGPLITLGVAALFGLILHRFVARPLARLTSAMRRLAIDETAVAIPFMQWGEEIGEMSRALAVFQKAVADASHLRGEQQRMRDVVAKERAVLLSTMVDSFEEVVGRIVDEVSASADETQSSARDLLGLADFTTREVTGVADTTKRATATMQVIASDSRDLSRAVDVLNERMAHSSRVAGQAVAEADRTLDSIGGLEKSAAQIGAIVELIGGIARQTNLLALNATIEAARAGEAGRGFSVVAGAVKQLADQTARATVEIGSRIEDIRSAAKGAGEAIVQIARTIAEMSSVTRETTLALDVQGAATRTMTTGTQDTAGLASAVSAQLEKVREGAVTTGGAATRLLASADGLARQSALLRDEARRFVTSVRAA